MFEKKYNNFQKHLQMIDRFSHFIHQQKFYTDYKSFQVLSHGSNGFPKVHHFGTCGGKYNALVMDLLGPNLEEVFNSLGRKFTLKTVIMLAIQLLDRLQHIHQ